VTILSSGCFGRCGRLSKVEFQTHSQLEVVDEHAFFGCSTLQEITLHSSLTSLGESFRSLSV
jgi:hypothetical protein